MQKYPRILFFVVAAMPTEEDFLASEELGPNVAFRNASMVPTDGALEKCDGVAGCVPTRYAEAYPTAEEAIAAYKDKRKAPAMLTEGVKPEAKVKPATAVAKSAVALEAAPKPAVKPVAWQPNAPTGN